MKIRIKRIVRYVITGPDADREKAFEYCSKKELRITRSGAAMISAFKVDPSRFKIVAEKEVEEVENAVNNVREI
jgi:hypothetical protein